MGQGRGGAVLDLGHDMRTPECQEDTVSVEDPRGHEQAIQEQQEQQEDVGGREIGSADRAEGQAEDHGLEDAGAYRDVVYGEGQVDGGRILRAQHAARGASAH